MYVKAMDKIVKHFGSLRVLRDGYGVSPRSGMLLNNRFAEVLWGECRVG